MSLFGQPATASSNPSLFGGTPAPAQPTAPLFGSSSGNALFGGSQQSQPSLFGAPAQSQQSQLPGTSLFGAPSAAQSQISPFGAQSQAGIFGAQSQPSVFGGASSQPGIFGGPAPSQPGLFSSLSQPSLLGGGSGNQYGQTQPAAGFGSAFGMAQQQQTQIQQPQQGSLLQQQQPSLFQQQQYAQFQSLAPLPTSTRVDQLPVKAIELLESVEKRLSDQRAKASHLFALQPQYEEKMRVQRDSCAATRRRLVRTDTGVEALATNANALRHAVRDERRAADSVAHSLAQLCRSLELHGSAHAWYSAYSYGNDDDIGPVPQFITHVNPEYFASVVTELEERANAYKREIDQIAEFLRMEGPVSNVASRGFDALQARMYNPNMSTGRFDSQGEGYPDRPVGSGNVSLRRRPESKGRAIEDVIRRQYEYFMVVANKAAAVHEALARLKDNYIADARRQDPDAVNPFAQADSREQVEEEKRRRIAASVQPSGLLTAAQSSATGANLTDQSRFATNTGSLFPTASTTPALGAATGNLALTVGLAAAGSQPATSAQPATSGQPANGAGLPASTPFSAPSTSFTGFGDAATAAPAAGLLGSNSSRRPASAGSGTRRHRVR
jgi:hypothetical protein